MAKKKKKVVIEVKKGLADVLSKSEGVEVIIIDKDDGIELVYTAEEEIIEKE